MKSKNFKSSLIAGIIFLGIIGIFLSIKMFLSPFLSDDQDGVDGYLKSENVENVLIGSSLTKQAYDVKCLEENSGESFYLIGYNNLSPEFMNLVVEEILNKKIPQRLFLEIYPQKFYQKSALQDTRLFFDLSFQSKLKLIQLLKKQNALNNRDLFELIFRANSEYLLTAFASKKILDHYAYHGAYLNRKIAGLTETQFLNLVDPWEKMEDFEKNNAAFEAVREIVNQCKAKGIELYFVIPPLPEYIRQNEPYQEAIKAVQPFLQNLQKEILDADFWEFENEKASNYADAVHLSTEGRQIYTQAFADFLL